MRNVSYTQSRPAKVTDCSIGHGVFATVAERLPHRPPLAVVVTDSIVRTLYADQVAAALRQSGVRTETFMFEAGEVSKTPSTIAALHSNLALWQLGRDGILIAVGGGVVGDVAGFAAATWMRGVTWVNCPTTMEADVDACIGGKTGVNLPQGKNLVGAFHHPEVVVVDPECFRTLSARDLRAGLAEAVKHALLQSEVEIEWLEGSAEAILALDPTATSELIGRNLQFKAGIVAEDPFEETGRRLQLNFGHTIGHAIESCARGELRHGECVALGMLAASRLSGRAGLLNAGEIERIQQLLTLLRLPTMLDTPLEREKVLETLLIDKKNSQGRPRFVLLERFGMPVIRDDIPADWIADAYDALVAP